jgi:hypothetical protein
LLELPVPDNYAALRKWRDELRAAVDIEIIRRLEPAFNRTIASTPHQTLVEKQDLCRWANAELRNLDLAIVCPKTGRPAGLCADQGNNPSLGRFQIELIQGRRKTISSPSIFTVRLQPRGHRVEGFSELWRQRLIDNNASHPQNER